MHICTAVKPISSRTVSPLEQWRIHSGSSGSHDPLETMETTLKLPYATPWSWGRRGRRGRTRTPTVRQKAWTKTRQEEEEEAALARASFFSKQTGKTASFFPQIPARAATEEPAKPASHWAVSCQSHCVSQSQPSANLSQANLQTSNFKGKFKIPTF